jgi:hypothetical protein
MVEALTGQSALSARKVRMCDPVRHHTWNHDGFRFGHTKNKDGPRSCEAGRPNCTCRSVPAPPNHESKGVGIGAALGSSAIDDRSYQDSFPTNA